MTEPFKVGYDPACPMCRKLDESCTKHNKPQTYRPVSGLVFPETPPDLPGEGWTKHPVFHDTYTMEVKVNEVDPDLLGILTGGAFGTPPSAEFSLNVFTPARRRTFWEWLRRKPKHHAVHTYFPRVKMAKEGQTDEH
jgi:hypothetical protein